MKMHFKKDSVIRFSLTCKKNVCGRVKEVFKDEIVYVPQKYVAKEEYDEKWGTKQLDPKVSVDRYPEVHLDRNFVAMWQYESVPCGNHTTYYGVLKPSEIVNIDVNHYDEEGFCKGHGDYFE